MATAQDLGAEVEDARQIDAVLNLVRARELPAGLEGRMMARLGPAVPGSVVLLGRLSRARLGWAAALPLAASLVLGIYLGAAGSLDSLLPTAVTGGAVSAGDDDGGMSDAYGYLEDQLT